MLISLIALEVRHLARVTVLITVMMYASSAVSLITHNWRKCCAAFKEMEWPEAVVNQLNYQRLENMTDHLTKLELAGWNLCYPLPGL